MAIIGGGPAGLVAAFHLTRNEPDAYDVTIYEMSWRLGGKTASGRGEYGRVEEHGLHILFGCYHNVFHTLRLCYDELRERNLVSRDVHRLQHFYDAISPHHFGVIGDDRTTPWQPLYIEFPSNRGVPGDAPLPSLFDLLSTAFQIGWMVVLGADSLGLLHRALGPVFDYRNRWKRRDFETPPFERKHNSDHARDLGGDFASRLLLKLTLAALDKRRLLGRISQKWLRAAHWLWRATETDSSAFFGRWWSAVDFFFALFRGVIADAVLAEPGGFEKIDVYDLREWLKRYDASLETLGSPWMRIIYDAAFSYPKGGLEPEAGPNLRPGQAPGESVAAGAALRALLLMTVTYKGSFYNKMEGGMADVIHTPLYLVLKARGVKFEFFHKLVDLVPAADGTLSVQEIVLETLPTRVAYDPLEPVNQMLCWPSRPRLEQLDEASRARAAQAESYAPSDAPRGTRTLTNKSDFDAVLLATPVACLPYVCPSLLAADRERPNLPKASLSNQHQIDTVQTIAVELWFKLSLKDLGWRRASPLLSLFIDPLNTWSDMTHLGPREAWPERSRPQNISYFCGALPHEHEFPRPRELGRAAEVAAAIVAQRERVTREFLTGQLSALLPTVRGGDGFNYSLLVDPRNRKDEQRLSGAYMRVNYEPHALCTLALPGKTEWRISPHGTGFDNLFVSGDWINNGVYLACVEGTFQSGILSARAIAAHFTGRADKYPIMAEGLLNLKPPTA